VLASNWQGDGYALDRNLYWTTAERPLDFAGMSFEEWRKKGQDANSVVADPLFVDAAKGDFRLQTESPALRLGFEPITTKFGRLTPAPADIVSPQSFPVPMKTEGER
jgi:hypothetical protein